MTEQLPSWVRDLDTTAQQVAFTAMFRRGIATDQCVRLVREYPQDNKKGRANNGWFDGVEAARQAVEQGDHSGFTLGFLGTEEYQDAFRQGVIAYYAITDERREQQQHV